MAVSLWDRDTPDNAGRSANHNTQNFVPERLPSDCGQPQLTSVMPAASSPPPSPLQPAPLLHPAPSASKPPPPRKTHPPPPPPVADYYPAGAPSPSRNRATPRSPASR